MGSLAHWLRQQLRSAPHESHNLVRLMHAGLCLHLCHHQCLARQMVSLTRIMHLLACMRGGGGVNPPPPPPLPKPSITAATASFGLTH